MGQKYKNIESKGIRIDPEWTQTARVTGFSWGYDMIYDEKGNTYSTGYVRSRIMENDKKWGPPPCPKGVSCQDVTFLSKRNKKGELIWRQYIFGSTRVLKLVLDKNGFVNMVGSIYSRKIGLSSAGSEPIILGKDDTYTGIFMCKYDKNGVVQQSKLYNNGKRPTALGFVIDEKENLYVRSHRPDGVPVEVKARVVRSTPAVRGTARIGVAIVEPMEEWLRLFVAWVADDQPASETDDSDEA